MARFALATLLVSTTLPFAAALAQTEAEPDVTPAAPVEVAAPVEDTPPLRPTVAPSDPPIADLDPVVEAPAPPPTTSPAASSIAAAPTPVEVGSVLPPATAPVPPVTPPAQSPAEAPPPAAPATPETKPRTAADRAPSRAAPVLTIVNRRTVSVTTVIVTAEAKTVRHAKPLTPNAKVTVKLPPMKGCLVTVAAAIQGGELQKLGKVNACKQTVAGLTD
jgi:hypothetical protein